MPELTTFSIVARCPRSGMLGVAVATAVPAVGGLCPFLRSGVGAVSTQSWVNPYLAIGVLDRLAAGEPAPDALERVLAGDEGRDLRQIGVVDAAGRAAAWTGAGCTGWAGQIAGDGWTVQGNMLVGEATLRAMGEAFDRAAPLGLAERLLLALEAGQAAGGDMRGKQSAALRVHGDEDYPWLDLRVDEHRHPVAELRRIHAIAGLQLRPFIDGMPRRGAAAGALAPAVSAMLLTPPPFRPGGGGSAP
ncbi:DUF1028 domain-containing protein [Azospirillum sp. ST 5-10]|uniref:DUF1028 domain-containing protein n=1 Tax=unclassified Azospirillum TaxID=2630922 RepID=UPI003F49EABD